MALTVRGRRSVTRACASACVFVVARSRARADNESLSTYAATFSFDAHVELKLVWCWHAACEVECAACRMLQRLVFITIIVVYEYRVQ